MTCTRRVVVETYSKSDEGKENAPLRDTIGIERFLFTSCYASKNERVSAENE